jgi:catechol 2,3-dioxygenase-like lactoylglutathione lyase family enzyme
VASSSAIVRGARGRRAAASPPSRADTRIDLELLETRTFGGRVVYRRYRRVERRAEEPARSATMGRVALQRMDNVGIVVESLDAAVSFFLELGLELEGRMTIEGDWAGRVTGVRGQRVEVAMMRMPDGHGKIELSRFLTPAPVADHRTAPVNSLGYLRVMFAVDDLDDTLARLRGHGAQVVDEVVEFEDVYRLCYVRGPEGILIGLAEQIG